MFQVSDVSGCQNNGAFLGPYYNTAPTFHGTQKGTTILTTTHVVPSAAAGAPEGYVNFAVHALGIRWPLLQKCLALYRLTLNAFKPYLPWGLRPYTEMA